MNQLKAPKGVTAISVCGETYNVPKGGIIEFEHEHHAEAARLVGFVAVDPAPVVVAPAADTKPAKV
jgi:hypothetical protein